MITPCGAEKSRMSQKVKTNPKECVVEIKLRGHQDSGLADRLREYTIPRTRHGRRVRELLSKERLSDTAILFHLKEFAYTERECVADNRLQFEMDGFDEGIRSALAKNDVDQRMLAKERAREAHLAAKSAQSQKQSLLACDESESDDDEGEDERDPFEEVDTWDVSSSASDDESDTSNV